MIHNASHNQTNQQAQYAFTDGKRSVMGIPVPTACDGPELVRFVKAVLKNCGGSYTNAGSELHVSPATVWKLKNGKQKDSPVVRERWNIQPKYAEAPVCPRCGVVHVRQTCPSRKGPGKPRPRISIHTTNMGNAASSIVKHIDREHVVELIEELSGLIGETGLHIIGKE